MNNIQKSKYLLFLPTIKRNSAVTHHMILHIYDTQINQKSEHKREIERQRVDKRYYTIYYILRIRRTIFHSSLPLQDKWIGFENVSYYKILVYLDSRSGKIFFSLIRYSMRENRIPRELTKHSSSQQPATLAKYSRTQYNSQKNLIDM